MFSRITALILATGLAIALAGCGSTSPTSTTGATSPAPTNPGTPPSPTPSPSPTPTPVPAADNYQADMTFLAGRTNGVAGTIGLNATSNNGSIKLQLIGDCGGPNANLVLNFWPVGGTFAQQVQVGTFTANADETANATFQFPLKGNFAGFFQVYLQPATSLDLCLGSGPHPSSSGQSYSTPLLPAASITGGVGAPTGTASGAGRVTVTGNTASVSLSNARAAQNFIVNVCGDVQHCTAIGTLTTDAQGNASGAFSMNGTGDGGNFVLSDSAGAEYVSGFHVQ